MSLEGMSDDDVRALASLAKSLGDSPKTRLGLMQLTKALDPSVSIPELDTLGTVANVKRQMDERFSNLEQKNQYKELEERLYAGRRKAVSAGHVKDSEIDDLEKFMLENGMADHEKAAQHFSNARKLAEPAPQAQAKYEMPRDHLSLFKQKGMTGLNEMIRNNAVQDLRDLRMGKSSIS